MSLAGPPADDEDLVRVLRSLLCGQKTPPWVNERDLYADVPEVVTADCEAAPGGGGDGRRAFYILTGLRSKAGGTSRTAGAGYWRIDRTSTIWPSAGEGISSSSSAAAPLGTSAALAFFARGPNGAEARTGWLMKESVLHHGRGEAPGFALCKVYRKRTPKTAAAAALLVAAQRSRLPASPPPLRLRAEIPHNLGTAAKSTGPASPAPASAPIPPERRWWMKKSVFHGGPGEPRGLALCKAAAAAAAASPFLAASAQEGRLPDSPAGLGLQEEIPHRLGTPASPAPASCRSPDTRWLLLQMEANSSPPRLGHKLSLKRVFHFLPLDEEQLEDGEIAESIDDKKKRARIASDVASIILEAQDVEQLNSA